MKKQWTEIINSTWQDRSLLYNDITQNTIHQIIEEVDKGRLRVAQQIDNSWQVNDWVKKGHYSLLPYSKNGNY